MTRRLTAKAGEQMIAQLQRESRPMTPEQRYAQRVAELEAEGMTTSDAQGVADAELGLPKTKAEFMDRVRSILG